MISSLLTFFAVGLAAIVVAGLVLAVVGTVLGIAGSLVGFLLFKVAPVMLVGWVVLKLLDRKSPRQISEADRRWLEGD
ncbi:MAG: hypothetical protein P8188_12840 [Gemmatimonadota bacterium]